MIEHWKNLSLEDIDGEVWRDIKGYEGLYQISNLGRVKSLSRMAIQTLKDGRKKESSVKNKILKKTLGKRGYFVVSLWRDNSYRLITVHRIVAITFIQNIHNKPFVNHIDLCKKNNCIDNLEWVTARENVIHAHKNGAIPDPYNRGKFGNECLLSKKVGQFDINGNLLKEWQSTYDPQRSGTEFRQGKVQQCCIGKKPQYKGYLWKYI
jgi:hypothetical protein